MSGYAHPFPFTAIGDEQIGKMETFMREKAVGLEINQTTDKSSDNSLDHEKMTKMFGKTFALSPEKFHFLPGDISFIKLLIAHVQQLVSTRSGRQKFNEKKMGKINENEYPPPDQAAVQASTCQQSAMTDRNNSNKQRTIELLEKVDRCLKSYGLDTANWNDTLFEVDSSGTYANVNCIVCERDDDGKPKSHRVYYYSSETRKGFWTLSNYEKHLKKVHLLVANRLPKISLKRKKKSNELEQEAVMESVLSDEEHEIQSQGDVDEENKETLLDLSIECIGSSGNIDSQILYAQISEQIQQMIAATMTNGEQQQNIEVSFNGHSSDLSVVETEGDGNCLYSALAHQLWRNVITSKQHEKLRKQLRSTVVEHILNPDNFSRYAFALEERLSEMKDIGEIDDLTAECKLYARHCLSREGQWGGLETINAVSCVYRVNVVVFDEHGKCYMIKEGNKEYKRTVVIAYRTAKMHNGRYIRNHYDSVTEINSNSIFAASEFISKK